MKRYFTSTVRPGSTAYHCDSQWHYMSLPGPLNDHTGGFVIVMMDGEFEVDPDWTEFPHLLEQGAANFNGIDTAAGAFVPAANAAAVAAIGGVTPTDNTFQVAKKLAAINRHFQP